MQRRVFLSAAAFSLAPIGLVSAADRRLFAAKMVPEDVTTPVDSQASGEATFTLDLATLRLRWDITWRDLSSPAIGAHLHGPGHLFTNALPLVDLAPRGIRNPLHGEAVIDEALLQYMIMTWAYVNLKTQRSPDGEIRAPVVISQRLLGMISMSSGRLMPQSTLGSSILQAAITCVFGAQLDSKAAAAAPSNQARILGPPRCIAWRPTREVRLSH